jgi:hypothetical protein
LPINLRTLHDLKIARILRISTFFNEKFYHFHNQERGKSGSNNDCIALLNFL